MSSYERVKKYTNTLNGRLKSLVKGARKSARDRKQDFAISYEDLQRLWDTQQGKCLYTGWEMSTFTKDLKLVSIERLDNSVGYLPENVVLICWCVNRARGTMPKEDFIYMCRSVSENNNPVI
jgi:hypothetical protein